jgi:hypothetical protein
MRVIQRLMGVENPLTDLKVYEHTLHFRNGIATIEHLSEREINRLRTFGFRVERDAQSKKAPEKPTPPVAVVPEEGPEANRTAESLEKVVEAAPSAPAPSKRSHHAKKEK